MKSKYLILIASVIIGFVNGLVFWVFEALVHDGTDLLWNSWLHTDEVRWLVVPVAIFLGIAFSFALRLLKEPRWTPPVLNILAEQPKDKSKPTLSAAIRPLATGLVSLLAGASLGPEAPLTENSMAFGKYVARKAKAEPTAAALLIAASIGSLMVAFIGSLILLALPFLLIYQKTKKIPLAAILPIVLSGLSAYAVVWLLDRPNVGFGDIPAPAHADLKDYAAALIVGFATALVAFWLNGSVKQLAKVTKQLDFRLPWYISAGIFGAVLGGLYLLGGQSVEFSGSQGTGLLVANSASYGTWAFLGLAVVKLLATSLSKASGYRGGLIFPSIYVGVAISLFIGALVSGLDGAGSMIGAIAGIFAAMTGSGIVGLVFIAAMIPLKLIGLAIVAVLAAMGGSRLLGKYFPEAAK